MKWFFSSKEERDVKKFTYVSVAHSKAPHDTALSNVYYRMVDGLLSPGEAYKWLKKRK